MIYLLIEGTRHENQERNLARCPQHPDHAGVVAWPGALYLLRSGNAEWRFKAAMLSLADALRDHEQEVDN